MQVLTEEDQQRLANLGKNGSRDVTGLTMTQWSPTNASFLRSISATIVALGAASAASTSRAAARRVDFSFASPTNVSP